MILDVTSLNLASAAQAHHGGYQATLLSSADDVSVEGISSGGQGVDHESLFSMSLSTYGYEGCSGGVPARLEPTPGAPSTPLFKPSSEASSPSLGPLPEAVASVKPSSEAPCGPDIEVSGRDAGSSGVSGGYDESAVLRSLSGDVAELEGPGGVADGDTNLAESHIGVIVDERLYVDLDVIEMFDEVASLDDRIDWWERFVHAAAQNRWTSKMRIREFAVRMPPTPRHWYGQLPKHIRRDWKRLAKEFKKRYCRDSESRLGRYFTLETTSGEMPCQCLYQFNAAALRAGIKLHSLKISHKRHIRLFIRKLNDPWLKSILRDQRIDYVRELEWVLTRYEESSDCGSDSDEDVRPGWYHPGDEDWHADRVRVEAVGASRHDSRVGDAQPGELRTVSSSNRDSDREFPGEVVLKMAILGARSGKGRLALKTTEVVLGGLAEKRVNPMDID